MKINILKSIIIFILGISFFAFAKIKYVSVEEIREMAEAEDIQTSRQYHERRKKNPNFNGKTLPALPSVFYKNWPGWKDVLVRKHTTLEETKEFILEEDIRTRKQYHERRNKNPIFKGKRLPADPSHFYKNWPSWNKVLARRLMTLEELKEFILEENIQTSTQYHERRKKNDIFKGKRLPANPYSAYPNWPGWRKAVVKVEYTTLEEIGEMAEEENIQTSTQYHERRKRDPTFNGKRLPANPSVFYKNWPGWRKALGNKIEDASIEEIREMALKENIQTVRQYHERRKKNDIFNGKRLPANPHIIYPDWTSWNDVLVKKVKKENKHTSLEEIKEFILKEDIRTSRQYTERRKKKRTFNGKILPANPSVFYKNWPGWGKFLVKKENKHVSMEEIKEFILKKNIRTSTQYHRHRKKNPNFNGKILPADPSAFYPDWTSWNDVLSREHMTIEELKEFIVKKNIRTRAQYYKIRGKDNIFNGKRSPINPETFYKNWPGWDDIFAECEKIFKRAS